MRNFQLLREHIPTTGFSAILDVLSYDPEHVYLTGFDFFQSKMHNVNQPWAKMNHSDPIGHDPEGEREWLASNLNKFPIEIDRHLSLALRNMVKADPRSVMPKRRKNWNRNRPLIKRPAP